MRTGVLVGCAVVAIIGFGLVAQDDACGPEVRSPIVIASDYEFTAENGVLCGSGTASDPYIIDGGTIDAGYSEYGIRIERTSRHIIIRGVTISGIAFDVLRTVDAVSREFRWDLGAGYCGKFQPAKVDAGGPYLRCQAVLGGRQE